MKLEKEADFAAELLVNHFKGRAKRHIVEDAVKAMADSLLRYGPGGRTTWLDMWDADKSVRDNAGLCQLGLAVDAASKKVPQPIARAIARHLSEIATDSNSADVIYRRSAR